MSWLVAEKIEVWHPPNAMQRQHFVGVTSFDPTRTFLSLAGYWCGGEKVIIGSHLFWLPKQQCQPGSFAASG